MKSIITIGLLALLTGCGGGESVSAGSTGGGSASSTASAAGTGGSASATTGTGGHGGEGPATEEVGEFSCNANETAIGPLNGEVSDANGTPIHQDGAIALLRVTPPSYPWTATTLTYGLATGGPCKVTDHEVVAFAGPVSAPPLHPAGAVVTPVSASSVDVIPGGAKVIATLAKPVTITAGEALWIGVRMHVIAGGGGARTCVYACDDVAPPGDPASWFSAVNAAAMVDLCPEDSCALNLLGESPSKAEAVKLNNDTRRWPYVVTGHK